MSFDTLLAERVREYLATFSKLEIEEKKMFNGLAFVVNGKMCVNASGQNLMCRFDPARTEEVAEHTGFLPVIMKGRTLKGFCYVEPTGFRKKKDFQFWIDLCLDFNDSAKPSKKRTKQ